MLASRASTWPRDHFCRSKIAPRLSKPTMWNEFLPISMPMTATARLRLPDMACSSSLAPLASFDRWRAGARPDHPICDTSRPRVAALRKAYSITSLARDRRRAE
jgi:hypothetical protein